MEGKLKTFCKMTVKVWCPHYSKMHHVLHREKRGRPKASKMPSRWVQNRLKWADVSTVSSWLTVLLWFLTGSSYGHACGGFQLSIWLTQRPHPKEAAPGGPHDKDPRLLQFYAGGIWLFANPWTFLLYHPVMTKMTLSALGVSPGWWGLPH